MKKKLRWKKNKRPTGLAAVCAGPVSHRLHDGETDYATVSPLRKRYEVVGWYWVAFRQGSIPHENTCGSPKPTIEEAKAEAFAFIKSHLEQQP